MLSSLTTLARRAALAAVAGLLFACGGGGGDAPAPAPEPEEPIVETVGPGQFKSATQIGVVGTAEMAAAIASAGTRAPAIVPKYPVTTWRLTYLTRDGQGREILASALASVPVKAAGRRSPVLAYQHGTVFRDREVPSNNAGPSEPAVLIASQGYIVVAADYVGYGVSKGTPHPYLLSAPTASAVVDLITAAKYWRQTSRILDNRQLFLAGYSEGGYATMAAHRALQTASSPHLANLVGVVSGAGPYSVTATMDGLLELVRERNEVLALLVRPGVLKNLSASVRAQLRDALLEQVIPDDADVSFQATFIDNYLADDTAALDATSNVHDWKPALPTRLYHGRDDRTVPYTVSTRTLAAMLARGATTVSLTDCAAVPAGHLDCVVPYFGFMLAQIGPAARDL